MQRPVRAFSSVSGGFPIAFMPGDYPTNHFDNRRTGWNPYETVLNTSNVNSANFGQLWTASVDSRVYAQPIVAMAETAGAGMHNVVFVGTMNDSLYAFDADTGASLWTRTFLNPPTVQIVPQSFYGNCKPFAPSIGIVATPVYDRSTHSLYVLVATLEPDVSGAQHVHERLHQIDVATGLDQLPAADISATTTYDTGSSLPFDPDVEPSRPGLLESEGNIYIGFSSFDSKFPDRAHGWIFAYSTSTMTQVGFLALARRNDGTNYFVGGPWNSGIGMAADDSGNVFFATAEGPTDGVWDFGDSVVKLPPTLSPSQIQFWTPNNYLTLYHNDLDLGSGSVMLFPPQSGKYPHLLWVDGKTNRGFLINADQLTGFSTSTNHGWIRNIQTHAIFGGPAFFQDANGIPWLYTSDNSTGAAYLAQYKVTTGSTANAYAITLTSRAPTPFIRLGGSEPVVSSNGSAPGTSIVWYTDRPTTTGPIPLYAFDASNVSKQLVAITAGQWTIAGTGAFLTPTVANGKVYVASDYEIMAFGIH